MGLGFLRRGWNISRNVKDVWLWGEGGNSIMCGEGEEVHVV